MICCSASLSFVHGMYYWETGFDTEFYLGFRLYHDPPNSLHVPARGTTSDLDPVLGLGKFQSTCPRGARRGRRILQIRRDHFNPRAHEGHDSNEYIHLVHK